MTIIANFERFKYFNFLTNFLENKSLFKKTGVLFFKLKPVILKTHHFHTKLTCQEPMLRQIVWEVQNGPITKTDVLPVATLYFFENCILVSEPVIEELIWCTNEPNVHIHTFRKSWNFIWGCFFPVSILNYKATFSWFLSLPLIFF